MEKQACVGRGTTASISLFVKNVNECQGWSRSQCGNFNNYIHVLKDELNNEKCEAQNKVKKEQARAKVISRRRQMRTYNRENSNMSKRQNVLKTMGKVDSPQSDEYIRHEKRQRKVNKRV